MSIELPEIEPTEPFYEDGHFLIDITCGEITQLSNRSLIDLKRTAARLLLCVQFTEKAKKENEKTKKAITGDAEDAC